MPKLKSKIKENNGRMVTLTAKLYRTYLLIHRQIIKYSKFKDQKQKVKERMYM